MSEIDEQLRSTSLRKAIAKELYEADPFQRKQRQHDEEVRLACAEVDADWILDTLREWPASQWLTQDSFDGLVCASLMIAFGAKRVLAVQNELQAVNVKLFAIVYEHLRAEQAA